MTTGRLTVVGLQQTLLFWRRRGDDRPLNMHGVLAALATHADQRVRQRVSVHLPADAAFRQDPNLPASVHMNDDALHSIPHRHGNEL